jgi:hypothetical protein
MSAPPTTGVEGGILPSLHHLQQRVGGSSVTMPAPPSTQGRSEECYHACTTSDRIAGRCVIRL